jgi:hypothetical protein
VVGVTGNGRGGQGADGAARIVAELNRLAAVYADERVLDIDVRPSRRLTASLARAYPQRALITLAVPVLASAHLEEVLVHEVAHIVCWWRHGRTRPHGRAWRELVVQAGQRPRVSMQPSDVRWPRRPRRRRPAPDRLPTLSAAREFLRSLLEDRA